MTGDDDLAVVNNEAAQQFEVVVGGTVATLVYQRRGSRLTLQDTRIPKELEGRGIAPLLARTALDYARDNGLRVIPICPYVAGYITRHPEYEAITIRETM